MTVADLLEILFDENVSRDIPVYATVGNQLVLWDLEGAHATLAGDDPKIVLELGKAGLP